MLFFRSEEVLEIWLRDKQAEDGARLSIPQLWQLSQRWYHSRMSVEYRGRTVEEVQKIFEDLGLTGEFWLGV